jgi:hypothetical protein
VLKLVSTFFYLTIKGGVHMEKVTVKAKNPHYDGYMFGYKFFNGVAKEVPLKDAEYMAKNFGVEIVKPEQPKEEPEKVKEEKQKRSPRKK